jgi:hypothetical protein
VSSEQGESKKADEAELRPQYVEGTPGSGLRRWCWGYTLMMSSLSAIA